MKSLQRLLPLGVMFLLVYMPFHVFISQSLSVATGGEDIWKIAKDVLTLGILGVALALAVLNRQELTKYYWWLVALGSVYALLHVVLYVIVRDTSFSIAAVATTYNSRLLAYLLIGTTAAVLVPKETGLSRVLKLVLLVSSIVCFLGFLQFMLPKDLLSSVGYSADRGIRPAFFIDDKPDLPRVNSTIRDPNSLGAYLLVPLTCIWIILITKKFNKRLLVGGMLLLHLLILFLTFSRAAWAAACISALVATVLYKKELLLPWFKKWWPVAVLVVIGMAAIFFSLRDQYHIQNIIFHSDENTVSQLDSNDYHVTFARQGLSGIIDQPMGHGPGTAGIVSIRKADGGLLTENYFIQIGYEVGVIGLFIFAVILLLVMLALFQTKHRIAIALFAAFCGYGLMAMVAHLWSNEAVAVNAWLLSGLLIGQRFFALHSQPEFAEPRRVRR